MAEYISAQANEFVAPLTSDAGNLFCVYGEYTLPSVQSGDVVRLVNIPANCMIVGLKIGTDGNTSGGTVKVGVSSDDDLFGTGVSLDGSEKELISVPVEGNFDDDEVIQATFTTAGTAASGKKLYVKVFYTLTNIL